MFGYRRIGPNPFSVVISNVYLDKGVERIVRYAHNNFTLLIDQVFTQIAELHLLLRGVNTRLRTLQ